ncbi:MAG: hypothetical protein S4CHLAM2_12440 [Chlamydiales bacterium]|nr:hypothetical protein [Chlamydiales bacterium]
MEPVDLENAFNHYMDDLPKHVPDGIVEVDLSLLQELGLLSAEEAGEQESDSLTHNFYVIESTEKLTLFNDKFSVWIVPKVIQEAPTTLTLIALNDQHAPQLEMAFATTGVYNHSSLVLRILEKFLEQIEENEEEICRFREG